MDKEQHVLIFSAQWCGPCRMMKAHVWNDEGVKNSLKNYASHKFIDIDESAGQQFAHLYGVQAVPTILIVDKKGKPVKATGTMNIQQTVGFLDG